MSFYDARDTLAQPICAVCRLKAGSADRFLDSLLWEAEIAARLAPQAKCPTCAQAETMEGIYLITLIKNLLGEDSLLAAYRASDGLCLLHLRQSLARVRNEGPRL